MTDQQDALDDGADLLGAAEIYEDHKASVEREVELEREFDRIARLPELEHDDELKELRTRLYPGADLRKFKKRFREYCSKQAAADRAEPRAPASYPFKSGPAGVHVYDERNDQWAPLCSRLEVAACTSTEADKGHGRLVELTTAAGTRHRFAIPMEMFAGNGDELRRLLYDHGLQLFEGKLGKARARNFLSDYIQAAPTSKHVLCITRPGWHTTADGKVFVQHGFAEVPDDHPEVVAQTGMPVPIGVGRLGDRERWKTTLAPLLASNPLLLFSIAWAFAGPLLQLLGEPSGGFHFVGRSKSGKSALLAIAASVWGKGALDAGVQPWRGTTNGVEALASQYSGLLLTLDEIGAATPCAVEEMVYLIMNERAKARMNADATPRDTKSWKLAVLSSGEVTVEQRASADRQRALHAGAKVRLANIPVEVEGTGSVFHDTGDKSLESTCADLYRLAQSHYGHAGREFLRYLVTLVNSPEGDAAREKIRDTLDGYTDELCHADIDPQARAVARRIALARVAGEIAVRCEALPTVNGEAFAAATLFMFTAWRSTQPSGYSGPIEVLEGFREIKSALETQAARFIEVNKSGEFEADTLANAEKSADDGAHVVTDSRAFRDQLGFCKQLEAGVEWWISPEVFGSDICKGHDDKALLREMRSRKWIQGDGKHNTTKRKPPDGATRRFVVVTPSFLPEASDLLEGDAAHSPLPTESEGEG
jgi:putative DNA primase/helicase